MAEMKNRLRPSKANNNMDKLRFREVMGGRPPTDCVCSAMYVCVGMDSDMNVSGLPTSMCMHVHMHVHV